ncbi:MAG: hypothetical protein LAN18_11525 [Acidobacteriia bacterium]|nr:hypothetical protein [Terriglobia bacterium]
MLRSAIKTITTAAAFSVISLVGCSTAPPTQEGAKAPASFAAVPGEKGGQDVSGPYDVVADWPKPLTSLPGHEKWTWGAVEGIFAESPDRVYILQRGELPALKRPPNTPVPQFGPSLSFPVNEVPFRNASQGPVAALPGEGGPGAAGTGLENGLWKGKIGVDGRWEHVLVVVNSNGDIVENWSQWDKMLKRPHAIYVNPYDAEKNVWVVDDAGHSVYKFTHDGKKLLLTLGTPGKEGADATHFNRPTFIAWAPDSTMWVADGYNGTRVAKFDKDGKFLLDWGKPGIRVNMSIPEVETRPGYFNAVHGIAYDPDTHKVFVNDRSNRRIQVFDENGKFLDMWSTGTQSTVYCLLITADHHIWAPDSRTWKLLEYDEDGHFLYSWGSQGDWPGAMWGAHQISVDQEGNLYMAEVSNGRAQKFRPRQGARPELLVGQPFRSAAWK